MEDTFYRIRRQHFSILSWKMRTLYSESAVVGTVPEGELLEFDSPLDVGSALCVGFLQLLVVFKPRLCRGYQPY